MTNYESGYVILVVIIAAIIIQAIMAAMLIIWNIILEEVFDIELKEIIKKREE